jgi:hypothetical protein
MMNYSWKNQLLCQAMNRVQTQIKFEVKSLTVSAWRWRGRKGQIYVSLSRRYWEQCASDEADDLKVIITLSLVNKMSRRNGFVWAEKYGMAQADVELLTGMWPQHFGIDEKTLYDTLAGRFIDSLPPVEELVSITPAMTVTFAPRKESLMKKQTNGKGLVRGGMDNETTKLTVKAQARDYACALANRVMADYGLTYYKSVARHRQTSIHRRRKGVHQIVFSYYQLEEEMINGRPEYRAEGWLNNGDYVGLPSVHLTALHEVAHAIQTANGHRPKGGMHNSAWREIFQELMTLYPY